MTISRETEQHTLTFLYADATTDAELAKADQHSTIVLLAMIGNVDEDLPDISQTHRNALRRYADIIRRARAEAQERVEIRSSIARGLADSAAGRVHDLGDFTQYADLPACESAPDVCSVKGCAHPHEVGVACTYVVSGARDGLGFPVDSPCGCDGRRLP